MKIQTEQKTIPDLTQTPRATVNPHIPDSIRFYFNVAGLGRPVYGGRINTRRADVWALTTGETLVQSPGGTFILVPAEFPRANAMGLTQQEAQELAQAHKLELEPQAFVEEPPSRITIRIGAPLKRHLLRRAKLTHSTITKVAIEAIETFIYETKHTE